MNLNDFKLLNEDDECYEIGHPNGKSIRVKKHGLSGKAEKIIQKWKSQKNYAEGGEVAVEAPVVEAPVVEIPEYLKRPEEVVAPMEVAPMVQTQAPIPGVANSDLKSLSQQGTSVDQPQNMLAQKQGFVNQALAKQQEAILGEGKALAQQGAQESKALRDVSAEIAKMPTQEEIMNQYKIKDAALMKAFEDKKVDPMAFYKNMGVGSKIAAGLALFLGGIGSGLTGQPNAAAASLKNLVDQDIEAQKNDQSKAMNAWKMNREALGSDLAANLATQNQLYTGLKYKLMQAGAAANSEVAKQKALQGAALLDQQMGQNNYQLSLIQQGLGTNTESRFSGKDPSILVPQIIKDPGMQKKAFEEVERAQIVKKQTPAILKAFDKAAEDQRGFTKNALPGINSPYVKAFHAEMGPTFQHLEGTVNQQAMQNMDKNLTPQWGDSDATIAAKREALMHYLQDSTAYPVTKGHGIDLNKFEATATHQSSANPIVRVFMEKNPQVSSEAEAIKILKKHGKM